jgi:L,D-transpeptidase ErfK/SrfK
VARREGFGYEGVANSNRSIDPWHPGSGTKIILPGRAIVPYGAGPGLTINLAELRLFHLIERDDGRYRVDLYPLGIGREGRSTPEGVFRINVKKQGPHWRVPEWLREQDPGLPRFMAPGPNNPLGDYWLGLSAPGYGIHGTNRPFGVGRRVSSGCIRMYPHDIARLYARVDTGTPVSISYQPIKATGNGDNLLLEVHPDYLGRFDDLFQHALHVISKTGWPGLVNYSQVQEVVRKQGGLPEIVGIRRDE